jgi:hypothetical protein
MKFYTTNDIKTKEYQEHKVFIMLDDFIEFYDSLSFNVLQFVSQGVLMTFSLNFESQVFSSFAGTLDSIKLILKEGHINDAYALLRKYDDGILTNLYIDCYIRQNLSLDNFIVEKVNNWAHGIEKFPASNKMIEYIRSYDDLSNLNTMIDFDGFYKKIRQRCNDNTHFNSIYFMALNDNSVYLENRIRELNQFVLFLRSFFIFHFVYLFTLNEVYMISSDYMDALDCGMQPEEDSQYWVASFVQDVFDKYVKPYRKDLADCLIEKVCMKLN